MIIILSMFTLYRAMCVKEAQLTLHFQSLQFNRNREKCFSPFLYWILENPCNGVFNNSLYDKGRYSEILVFKFTDVSKNVFVKAKHEWKIHIRKTSLIELLEVTPLKLDKTESETRPATPKPSNQVINDSYIRPELRGSYQVLTTGSGEREDYDDQPHY